MQIQNLIGIAAGCLTAVSLLPQIIKVIREKNAETISTLMPFVLLIGNGLWVYYGILLSAWPITITNAFSLLCDLLLILLRFRYKPKSKD
ncbi:SemiSWEET transporter [Pedobacter aquatilis]|uniref:SemiSWEET family sugar transporter n=1 Tax=Pedobacter aquatilis TaxID=351343 RepID=UPI00292D18F7|nr:SemiSWEET transporter [Pedobacter aquatilis]